MRPSKLPGTASGVSFTLQSGDQSYSGGTQQTDNGGNTSWQGIPLGSGYSISESIPSGYGDPWVYCEISGDPNNSGDTQQSFFQATGGNMDVGYSDPSLTAYTQASCYWFNWSTDQNGQGAIRQRHVSRSYPEVRLRSRITTTAPPTSPTINRLPKAACRREFHCKQLESKPHWINDGIGRVRLTARGANSHPAHRNSGYAPDRGYLRRLRERQEYS